MDFFLSLFELGGAHLQCVCNHCNFLKLLKENCCSYRLHKLSTIWFLGQMDTTFFRQMDGLEDGHCVFQTDGRTRRWTLFFRQMDGLEDGHCIFQTDGRTRRWTLFFRQMDGLEDGHCFSDRWTD
jgi:hypothetical protein